MHMYSCSNGMIRRSVWQVLKLGYVAEDGMQTTICYANPCTDTCRE
jgi:hypothetical protein